MSKQRRPVSRPIRTTPPTPRRPVGMSRSRWWRAESPTDPLPMIDVLRGTPYRNPEVRALEEEKDARASMDLALKVGELMLRCGADAPRVEASVVAVAAAAGLDNLEVDITLQSLLLQCTTPEGLQITMLRVVRSSTRDFERLVAVHEFVESLVEGDFDRDEARRRLRLIQRAPRFWPRWAVTASAGVLAGSVAIALGGGLLAAIIAGLAAILVDRVSRELGKRGLPEFYTCALGGFVATVVSWVAYGLGRADLIPVDGSDFAYIVAGGIVVLLPGRTIAAAFEDVISGYSVTGAGRILTVLLTTAGIILGVATGLTVTLRVTDLLSIDLVAPDITSLQAGTAAVGTALLGALLTGVSATVLLRSRRKLVLPTSLLSVLGIGMALLVQNGAGTGRITAVGLSTVLLGFLGRLVALRLGAPAMVLTVPATFALLPGLSIFQGLYELVGAGQGSPGTLTVAGGTASLFGAVGTLLAIATGIILGEFLAAPFDHRAVQKRRARRR